MGSPVPGCPILARSVRKGGIPQLSNPRGFDRPMPCQTPTAPTSVESHPNVEERDVRMGHPAAGGRGIPPFKKRRMGHLAVFIWLSGAAASVAEVQRVVQPPAYFRRITSFLLSDRSFSIEAALIVSSVRVPLYNTTRVIVVPRGSTSVS